MTIHYPLLLLTLLACSQASALVVRDYSATRHIRLNGFPNSPSINQAFIHAGLDLSGVGWNTSNTNFQYTMVSPLHFIGANHARPNNGNTLHFITQDGIVRNYTVASSTAITNDSGEASDLFIGTLSSPIPSTDGVNFHPYINLPSELSYTNKQVIILGKPARGAKQRIHSFQNSSSSNTNTTRVFTMRYLTAFGNDDDAHVESGDSGSPVFIDENDIAAIVGVNSLVSSTTSVITSHANSIPYYAAKLNAEMATKGYHMTKSRPGTTSITLSHQLPAAPIRAGHSFNITLSLTNTTAQSADNVKVSNTLPAATVFHGISGSEWFSDNSGLHSRRANIAGSALSPDQVISITIPSPGSYTHTLRFSSDQSAEVSQNHSLSVIESFVSFASSLADQSPTGDDDLDGISNLLEYIFGGDPATPSQLHQDGVTLLMPQIEKDGASYKISFLRRKDAALRAITYQLTSSTTLENGTWSDATSQITGTSTTSLSADFEKVTHSLSSAGNARFFRIEATLAE